MAEAELRCNFKHCRKCIDGMAWVTACSHIFCDEDGEVRKFAFTKEQEMKEKHVFSKATVYHTINIFRNILLKVQYVRRAKQVYAANRTFFGQI